MVEKDRPAGCTVPLWWEARALGGSRGTGSQRTDEEKWREHAEECNEAL